MCSYYNDLEVRITHCDENSVNYFYPVLNLLMANKKLKMYAELNLIHL